MEQILKSRVIRIVAATAAAVVIAVVMWRIAELPEVAHDVAVAPASDQTNEANDTSKSPEIADASPPVMQALPTEPDPVIADSGPPADAPSPVVDGTSATSDAPKYANAVPDRAPRPKADLQTPSKPAPPRNARVGEQTVMHVRRLQTQLLVGTLSCGRPHMKQYYNSFVTRFDHALKANGQALTAYFRSRFGARGVAEMDSFLTKLSNELSLVSMRNGEFCERTDGLFDTVLALAPSEIETFADRYLTQPVVARDGF